MLGKKPKAFYSGITGFDDNYTWEGFLKSEIFKIPARILTKVTGKLMTEYICENITY